jgi:hypothetical protein
MESNWIEMLEEKEEGGALTLFPGSALYVMSLTI